MKRLLCLLPLVLPSPLFAQEEIGTHGATLDLERSWRRQEITSDIDGDQFVGSGRLRNHYLIVIESSALFVDEQDFAREMDISSSDLLLSGEDVEASELVFERLDGDCGHASRTFNLVMGGLDLSYEVHILGRDCCGYVVMAWTLASGRKSLATALEKVVEGFAMPGADTPWARSTSPSLFKARIGARAEVQFSLPRSIFSAAPDSGDAELALMPPEHEIAVYLFESSAWQLDAAIDDVFEALGGTDDGLERVSRRAFDLGERAGALSVYRWPDEDISVESLVLPVEPDTYVDLRFTWAGEPQRYADLRTQLWDSLRIEARPAVDAFPPPVSSGGNGAQPNAGQAALLAAAEELGEVHASATRIQRGAAGLYFMGGSTVHVLADGAARSSVVFSADWGVASVGALTPAGELLVDGRDGAILRVRDGVAEPLEPVARAFAPLPDGGLLLASERTSLPVGFGFGNTLLTGGELLHVPERGGARSLLADLAITSLVASVDGRAALVGAYDPSATYGAHDVCILAVADGARTELGRWEIGCVGHADDGWLVTGRRGEGPLGIHRVTYAGEVELLVSGDSLTGVELRDGNLLFSSLFGVDYGSDRMARLHRVDLATARRLGPACQPFGTAAFDALVREALTAAGIDPRAPATLESEAAVRRVATAIRAVALARGSTLPSTTQALDELVFELVNRPALGAEGWLGATALVIERLLDEGARWVAGPAGGLGFHGTGLPDHAHAVAFLPTEVVAQVAIEDSSWWHPAGGMLEFADGRELLIGSNAETLRAALAETRVALKDLAQLSDADARELLDAAPRNRYLRGLVYRALAGAGRLEVVEQLARPYATGDAAGSVDVLAFLAAAVHAGKAPIEELRAAIAEYPQELELYLLLGSAYESQGAARLEHARACYEHAYENGWGAIEEEAGARLAELDEE